MLKPSVKIIVIYDNQNYDDNLKKGFGFSCLVEMGDRKILFDTGGDPDAFFSNAEKLGISLETISHVFFSHKHWDHRAGFEQILSRLREKTALFLPKAFPTSLLKKIPPNIRTTIVTSFAEIDNDIYSLVLKGGFFLYEQSLLLSTQKGIVILTGCAHPGIVHILEAAQKRLPGSIYLVMGGFHLLRSRTSTTAEVVRKFQDLRVAKVAPCHCSGERTMQQFEEAYGDSFTTIGTGSIVTIS